MKSPFAPLLHAMPLLLLSLAPHVSMAAGVVVPTIERIEISTRSSQLPHTYTPGNNFLLLVEENAVVHVSDGTLTGFGAGGSSGSTAPLLSVSASGTALQFTFGAPDQGNFFERVSFGTLPASIRTGFLLKVSDPVVLTAQTGSFNAVLTGNLLVARNGFAPPFTGTEYALLGAGQGELIPFSVTYTRIGTPWSQTSFNTAFSYTMRADFDTSSTIPEPTTMTCMALFGTWFWMRRRR